MEYNVAYAGFIHGGWCRDVFDGLVLCLFVFCLLVCVEWCLWRLVFGIGPPLGCVVAHVVVLGPAELR